MNDEIEVWKALAKDLHDFIGRHVGCSCTETEEYKEFFRNFLLQPTPAKRLLYSINHNPETEIEEVCERCNALLAYERLTDPIWANQPSHRVTERKPHGLHR